MSAAITDPQEWWAAVDRVAEAIAASTWGVACWYRGTANAALAAALGLDADETWRIPQPDASDEENER